MTAILKREMNSYFKSPIGYVYLAIYFVFTGLFFSLTTFGSLSSDMSTTFTWMFIISMLLIPLLTMKLMGDDRRQKTDQVLLTAPVNVTSIVLGKFFAAFLTFCISVGISLFYAVLLSMFSTPAWSIIVGNIIGLLFVGLAMVAIGQFVSSLTESPVVSIIITYAISIFLILMDMLIGLFNNDFMYKLIGFISFNIRYSSFTGATLDLSCFVYFISLSAIFLFLTVRMLESRRWS